MALTAKQEEYISKCQITPIKYIKDKYKYVVQTPLGFHAGTYYTEQEAKRKVLGMAKHH